MDGKTLRALPHFSAGGPQEGCYLAPNSRFFQRRLWPLHLRQIEAAFAFLAPQVRHTL